MAEPLPRCAMIFIQTRECAATDEQDVRGVDLQEFLLRMLAPALGRNTGHRAFHDFQKRLLHAFTRTRHG